MFFSGFPLLFIIPRLLLDLLFERKTSVNSSLRFAKELLIGYTAVLAKLMILWFRRRIAHRKTNYHGDMDYTFWFLFMFLFACLVAVLPCYHDL